MKNPSFTRKQVMRITILVVLSTFLVTPLLQIAYADGIYGTQGLEIIEKEQREKHQEKQKKQKIVDSVPDGCKNPTGKFGECPKSYYRLDYVPKGADGETDLSWFEQGAELANNTLNNLFNAAWELYMNLVIMAIYFIWWWIDLPLMDLFYGPMVGATHAFNKWIWMPMFSVACFFALLALIQYQRQKRNYLIGTSIASIAIIASIGWALYMNMPATMKYFDKGMDNQASYVLWGISQIRPDEENPKKVADPSAGGQDVSITDAKAIRMDVKQRVADAIWKPLIHDTYLELECGNKKVCQTYIGQLFEHGGTSMEMRRNWLIGKDDEGIWGDKKLTQHIDPETGRARTKGMENMTAEGLWDRGGSGFFMGIIGLFQTLLFIAGGMLGSFFSAMAASRYLWGSFRISYAIHPENGFREFFDWLWSVFHAIMMKFFLSVLLGLSLVLWMFTSEIPASEFGTTATVMVWLGRLFVYILLVVALYFGFLEVKDRFNFPMPGGPNFSTRMEGVNQIGRQGRGLVGGMVDGSKGFLSNFLKNAGRAGAAFLGYSNAVPRGPWRLLSDWRKARRQYHAALDSMYSRGYDPNSLDSRSAYLQDMANEGRADEAHRHLQALGPIHPEKVNKTPVIRANLSRKAENLYEKMRNQGFNPLAAEDRMRWLQKRPGDGRVMEEIANFAKADGYRRMIDPPARDWTTVPPEPPRRNTAAYDLWVSQGYQTQYRRFEEAFKQLERQRRERQEELDRQYQNMPLVRRIFTPAPKVPKVETQDVLEHLRNLDLRKHTS